MIESITSALFGNERTQTGTELELFAKQRQHERAVFDSALRHWLLQSGLGPIMMAQTEEFAQECGYEEWPEQFNMYRREFDPRNPRQREILEYIQDQSKHDLKINR